MPADPANAPLILSNEPNTRDDNDFPSLSPAPTESSLNHPTPFLWLLTLSAGISGLLFGYDTGVISATLVSIRTSLNNRPLTTLDKSLITSITALLALIFSPIAGWAGDRYGRKRVVLACDLLFITGALLQAFATTVAIMVIGRGVVGAAVGGASLVVPMYIGELAPSVFRGRLVVVQILLVTGGQVVAYVVGWSLSGVNNGWRWMVGLGALPACVQYVLLLFLPESPRWLVKAGREGEARRILQRVFGSGVGREGIVEGVVDGIVREAREEDSARRKRNNGGEGGVWDGLTELLRVPAHRRALTIACLLQGLQQLCGFNSLMYYSATIFSLLSFTSPTLTALIIACTNFAFTLLAFHLIDRVGRRRILLYTIPVMTVALLLCSMAFALLPASISPSSAEKGTLRFYPVIIVCALAIYVAAYATGLGNVPWQQGELFPLSVRSLGSGVATATNWGSNFLVGVSFLWMMGSPSTDKSAGARGVTRGTGEPRGVNGTPGWGPSLTFAGYAIVCAAGWWAVWWCYPETSGLSLEDVGGLLADGWGVREGRKRVAQDDG